MRPSHRWAWILLIGALTACVRRQVDLAAEEAALRDLGRRWLDAIEAKDTMRLGDLYAEDAVWMPPNAPRVSGQANIRTAWAQVLATPGFALHLAPEQIVVSEGGDVAYEIGTYHARSAGDRGPAEDTGKYVVVWKRVGADWRVAAEIFNSDRPEQ